MDLTDYPIMASRNRQARIGFDEGGSGARGRAEARRAKRPVVAAEDYGATSAEMAERTLAGRLFQDEMSPASSSGASAGVAFDAIETDSAFSGEPLQLFLRRGSDSTSSCRSPMATCV